MIENTGDWVRTMILIQLKATIGYAMKYHKENKDIKCTKQPSQAGFSAMSAPTSSPWHSGWVTRGSTSCPCPAAAGSGRPGTRSCAPVSAPAPPRCLPPGRTAQSAPVEACLCPAAAGSGRRDTRSMQHAGGILIFHIAIGSLNLQRFNR